MRRYGPAAVLLQVDLRGDMEAAKQQYAQFAKTYFSQVGTPMYVVSAQHLRHCRMRLRLRPPLTLPVAIAAPAARC
jgi:hypothetical protein